MSGGRKERRLIRLGASIMTRFQYRFELNLGKSFSHAEEDRVEEELKDLGGAPRVYGPRKEGYLHAFGRAVPAVSSSEVELENFARAAM